MKKYALLAIIAITTCTISCNSDNEITPITEAKKTTNMLMQKVNDTTGIDTGGQGGSTPIKP